MKQQSIFKSTILMVFVMGSQGTMAAVTHAKSLQISIDSSEDLGMIQWTMDNQLYNQISRHMNDAWQHLRDIKIDSAQSVLGNDYDDIQQSFESKIKQGQYQNLFSLFKGYRQVCTEILDGGTLNPRSAVARMEILLGELREYLLIEIAHCEPLNAYNRDGDLNHSFEIRFALAILANKISCFLMSLDSNYNLVQ